MSIVNEQAVNNQIESAIAIGQNDREHLLSFERRCDLLRDRTRSVSERYQNGVYIVGRPGAGKSHVVRETLEKTDARFVWQNARMSPLGLFELLDSHSDETIVLDDLPSIFDQRQALQITMAALGGEPGQPRLMTYTTKRERKSFHFRGGLIAVSNIPLRHDPFAHAIESRVVLLEHEPTDEELEAVMRDAASQGRHDLTPAECRMVVDFVIQESRANDFRLDLRCMVKGWQDYRQFRDGKSLRSWQDLICASMRQILRQTPQATPSKQQEIDLQRERVRHLLEQYPDDTQTQIAKFGLSRSTFYQRRREVLSEE